MLLVKQATFGSSGSCPDSCETIQMDKAVQYMPKLGLLLDSEYNSSPGAIKSIKIKISSPVAMELARDGYETCPGCIAH